MEKTMKNAEKMVDCPVCKDNVKESAYNAESGMCARCFEFLGPERGGEDHGVFMIRIQTVDDTGRRSAEIRPRGFWSASIEVREQVRHEYNRETHAIDKKWNVSVSWGTGGKDGTVDDVQAAENFARAMDHAVLIAKAWRMERHGKKED